jgi:hypothetical protein
VTAFLSHGTTQPDIGSRLDSVRSVPERPGQHNDRICRVVRPVRAKRRDARTTRCVSPWLASANASVTPRFGYCPKPMISIS